MSDFKAKISAELDTSKIEQQIDELNGKKIKLDVDTGDTAKEVQNVNDTLNNKDSELYGRVGRTDYEAAVDLIIPESIDSSDKEAVNSYMDSIYSLFTYDDDGNRAGLNIDNFCKQAVDEGLMYIDEASGSYQIAGQKTMEDFANGMNLSLPLVQAIFGEMEEFGGVFDWSDEANKTFGDLAVSATEAREALRKISGNEELEIKLDVSDIEDTQGKLDTLDATITEMNSVKSKPEVDPSEVEYANEVIRYCVAQKQLLSQPDVMMVDTSVVEGDLGNAIGLLQEFQTAKNNLEVAQALDIDTTQAQANLDAATQKIQDLDANITSEKALNIDTKVLAEALALKKQYEALCSEASKFMLDKKAEVNELLTRLRGDDARAEARRAHMAQDRK